jgi:ABC-type Zn uptake system ZnuABC Zn-binding protein ZnuA
MRTMIRCFLTLALAAALVQDAGAQEKIPVLTTLPVTYSISSALAQNTSITVQNIPERARPMGAQAAYLEMRADQLREQFQNTQAVVTIGKLWTEDPLFTAVRSANIHVIDIDATKPWSATLEGISVALQQPQHAPWVEVEPGAGRDPSVYFWLSPANGARAAEIIAADFMRISPKDSEQIGRNLTGYRRQLLDLKREYEEKFATLPNPAVFALASEFVYLTTDMSIYVDGSFFRQDIEWTPADLENLKSYLKMNEVKVAIHKWDPAAPIKAAIEGGGAKLVVLDTIDVGVEKDGKLSETSYVQLMRANLEALYNALSAAK